MFAVYHLADIHIKDDRRSEYRAVFQRLFDAIKNENAILAGHTTMRSAGNFSPKSGCQSTANSASVSPKCVCVRYAVISGDVFDAKIKVSSNNITDFFYLVDNLLELCDYVVTMYGNHDINLNNSTSVDLITPLVRRYNDRLIHCAETGSYVVPANGGVCFNVISPSDACVRYPFDFACVHNILLLHENVEGVRHAGYALSGRIRATEFARYSMVMCGHIHECIWIGDNGAYCGALVQQNIGESFSKGFVLWTASKSSDRISREFKCVSNEVGGYLKLTESNGGEFKHNDHPYVHGGIWSRPAHPLKIVIEVQSHDKAAADRALVVSDELARKHGVIPTIHRKVAAAHTDDSADSKHERSLSNLQYDFDKDKVSCLIQEELARNVVSANIQSEVMALHTQLSKAAWDGTNQSAARQWRLVSLEWSNLYCYGGNNALFFDTGTPYVYGIIADNKSGKSAVIDIFTYMLYNKLLRGDANSVLNKRASSGFARVVFESDGRLHVVERAFGLKPSIKYTVAGRDCTDEKVSAVYERVSHTVGSFDEFVTISTVAQGRSDDFMSMTNPQRFEFLKRILRLDALEIDLETAKEHRRDAQSRLSVMMVTRDRDALSREMARVKVDVNQAADKLKALERVAAESSNANPCKPARTIEIVERELNDIIRALQPINKPHATKETIQIELEARLDDECRPTKTQIGLCEKRRNHASTPLGAVVNDDLKNLADLKDEKARLEIELAGLPRQSHRQHTSSMPNTSDDELTESITKTNDEYDRLSHQYDPCLNSFNLYVQSHARDDIKQELDLHASIDQVRVACVDDNSADERSLDLVEQSLESALTKLQEMRSSIDAAIKEIRACETKLDRGLDRYERFVAHAGPDVVAADLGLWTQIEEYKARLVGRSGYRTRERVLADIRGRSSEAVSNHISELNKSLLHANQTYKAVVAQIQYNDECACCSSTRDLLHSISGTTSNARNEIEVLKKERAELVALETELTECTRADAENTEIARLMAALTIQDATAHDVRFVHSRYQDIKSNCERRAQANELRGLLSAYETQLAALVKENADLAHARNRAKYRALIAKTVYPYNANISSRELSMIYYKYDCILNNCELQNKLSQAKHELDALLVERKIRISLKFKRLDEIRMALEDAEYVEAAQAVARYDVARAEIKRLKQELVWYDLMEQAQSKRDELEQTRAEYDLYDSERLKQNVYIKTVGEISETKGVLHELDALSRSLDSELDTCSKREALEHKVHVLTEYVRTLDNKTGIPVRIIQRACAKLTDETNRALKDVADFSIKIDVEQKQKTSQLRLYICDAGELQVPVDMGSGFQKFVISIALRNAFAHITRCALADTLIIDEGFACLDDKNLSKIIEIIPSFKTRYKNVLIISHLDLVKAAIERPIYIDTTLSGHAHIQFGTEAQPPTASHHQQSISTDRDLYFKYCCDTCNYGTNSDARFKNHNKSKEHLKRMAKH